MPTSRGRSSSRANGKEADASSRRRSQVEELQTEGVEEEHDEPEEEEEDGDDEDLRVEVEEDQEEREARTQREQMLDDDEEEEVREKVCEGQSLEERRRIRADLHDHKNKVVNEKQAMEQGRGSYFEKNLLQSNNLFKKVKYTREAVVDADTLVRLASVPLRHVEKLSSQTARYDFNQVLESLKNKFKAGQGLDWAKLGACVAPCFRTVPEASFMLGPLDKPPVQRKERQQKRKRATEETAVEVQPEEVAAQGNGNDDTHTHEKVSAARIGGMKRLIEKTVGSCGGRVGSAREKERLGTQTEVDVFHLLFNPKSFTQTVENLFDLSFNCKEGAASFVMNKDEVPVIRAGEGGEEPEEGAPVKPKRQAVLSLSMQDWQDLCEAYNVTECMVPDRPNYTPDPLLQRMMTENANQGQGSSQGNRTGGGGGGGSRAVHD